MKFVSLLRIFLLSALVCCLVLSTAAAWGADSVENEVNDLALEKRDKDQQLELLEYKVMQIRSEKEEALRKLYEVSAARDQAQKRQGFFYTKKEDKANIKILDEEYKRAILVVESETKRENYVLAKLKPLYGVLSVHFAAEQKQIISEVIKSVQGQSYNNAFYSSLFSFHEAESLIDIIVGFLSTWVLGFLFMYPFAVAYYALWAAPWSVYAYSSGLFSIAPGIFAYATSVLVMCLPLIVLGSSLYIIWRHYEKDIVEILRQRSQHFHRD